MNAVGIIPARGGSKGIKSKNIRLLQNMPLIWHTIEQARRSRSLQRIIVSTDDRQIARIAAGYGAEVIPRPVALALDVTPMLSVLQHVISHLEDVENVSPDLVVLLQPTSPLRCAEDIDQAIRSLLQSDCDSVVSVCESEHPLQWMYTVEKGMLKPLLADGQEVTRRQDAPRVYRLNGAVCVTRRKVIMEGNRIIGKNAVPHVMPPERSVDIDTELDFQIAELLMGRGAKTDG